LLFQSFARGDHVSAVLNAAEFVKVKAERYSEAERSDR